VIFELNKLKDINCGFRSDGVENESSCISKSVMP